MSRKSVQIGAREFEAELRKDGPRTTVRLGEDEVQIEVQSIDSRNAVLRVDGKRMLVPYRRQGDVVEMIVGGEVVRAEVEVAGRKRTRHREDSLSAPMPGVILKIFVAEGDVVAHGAPLIVLEAMKMEHQLTAPHDGTVSAIRCQVGELVQPGVELITVNPSEGE